MSDKVGTTIILIGSPGMGKTPINLDMIEEAGMSNLIAYDIRGEYVNIKKKFPFIKNLIIHKKFSDFKKILHEIKNSYIVIEEASGVISAMKDLNLTEILIGIEHNNNIAVFIFHTLMDAPKYILNKVQFVMLLPTADDEKDIKTSRSAYFEAWKETMKRNLKLPKGKHKKPVIIKQR